MIHSLNYINLQCVQLLEWARCGDNVLSVVPTILWAVGSAAFAHRIVSSLFKRFMFRRIPLWEIILQHLIFIWMVIYSLHFWTLVVKIIKIVVEYYYSDEQVETVTREELEGRKVMQQWIIWLCGATPLALFYHTRPRPSSPPLMIWITTSPWQRREMGPYGYYLHRPPSLETPANTVREQAIALRKAYSDSRTIIKEPPRKRRNSKSV
ncbi:unnamed protein product [Pieris macdunnoughi]|uniref:Uncharacterized protein n=1 Tax=Pieris macdunnoughi TaxID=345717 RepID=A0A821VJV0_9NEOP|nr:unnamed protein product [Pieris macdunnoughi]